MERSAIPGRGVGKLAGMGAHICQELGHALRGVLRRHDQHVRRGCDHADRREIADRVPGQVGEQRLIRDQRDRVEHDCVAVRGGAGGGLHADVAGCAAAVVDDDARAELGAEGLGDEARGNVDAAAGGKGRDQADRLARITLGHGKWGDRGMRGRDENCNAHPTNHRVLLAGYHSGFDEEDPAVKAPSFAYAKPGSLEEAFELARRPGAKVLAGGQSLIPALNMRLSQPELLVDISGLPFREMTLEQGVLRIGALVTHSEIEKSEEIARHVPLLAEAARQVAHPAIRNRGTVGGSIALADPAAEYPACMVALDASVVVAGAQGERLVKAQHFFKGLFEVDLAPGELVAAVEVPAQLKDQRSVFLELARRHGDYAIIGLAAYRGKSTRFVFCGAGPTPILAKRASAAGDVREAKAALDQDLDPPATLYNSSATKLHLAKVLLERAWTRLSTSQ